MAHAALTDWDLYDVFLGWYRGLASSNYPVFIGIMLRLLLAVCQHCKGIRKLQCHVSPCFMLFVQNLAPEKVKAHASFAILAVNPMAPQCTSCSMWMELTWRAGTAQVCGRVSLWRSGRWWAAQTLKEPLRGGGNGRNASAMLAAWSSKQV